MATRYVIETNKGFITSSKGNACFSNNLESAKFFKTEHAANQNRFIKSKYLVVYDAKVITVELEVRKV